MEKTNRLSVMRLSYILGISLILIVQSIFMCYEAAVLLDQFICIIALNIIFILVFSANLIHQRLNNTLKEKVYNSYGKIFIAIILCTIINCLSSVYAPDFFAPVMIYPLLLSAVFDKSTDIVLGLYYVCIFAICQNFSTYILICYILLIVFGTLVSEYLLVKDLLQRIFSYVLIISLNAILPVIFYYFSFLEISIEIFIYGLIDGLIVSLLCVIIVPLLSKHVENSKIDIYEELIAPNYSLVEEIHKFSYIEYKHAQRVSSLSRKCADKIGANSGLAECGGFYYRLGKMQGEPMIDNAIKLANNHCFPADLINIISEYGGIINLPSSKESAIVHMVDAVVTKVELFDADSMSSSWNQNMVIYQTINELSQQGIYDNSGLSMNQFLIIRDCLAKEDILA